LISSANSELANEALVQGDNMRLRQVFSNLVDNAIRHSAPNDTVSLETNLIDDPERPLVQITVRDTGEGITEDFIPQVFDRFSRADPSRTRGTGGSGVGLAICQKLVEAHGGTISVTSRIGEGSSFIVKLPASPGPAT
jgi:two-component system sensor histidine kinase BaeS